MATPNKLDLCGVWVPIVTPFSSEGALDTTGLRQLADHILAEGATGLVALGTTGEPATLSGAERVEVVGICSSASDQAGAPLIVGAGTNSTAGTIHEINRLSAAGNAAAALVVVPYYTRPSEQAVVEHFHVVADASPIPIVIYNIPYRTGRGLGVEALLEAGSHPNVIGLKQSVGSLDHDTLELLRRRSDGFHIMAGDDAFITPTVLMGGSGAIAAAAHFCTPLFVSMVDAAANGNVRRAESIAARLLPVVDAGFAEPSPAVWKAALHHRQEIMSNFVRRPMTEASPGSVTVLIEAAANAVG